MFLLFGVICAVLGIEPRTLNLIARHSTTEYTPALEMMLLRKLSAHLGGSGRRPMMTVSSQVSVQKINKRFKGTPGKCQSLGVPLLCTWLVTGPSVNRS